jgi:hypothetical protein
MKEQTIQITVAVPRRGVSRFGYQTLLSRRHGFPEWWWIRATERLIVRTWDYDCYYRDNVTEEMWNQLLVSPHPCHLLRELFPPPPQKPYDLRYYGTPPETFDGHRKFD